MTSLEWLAASALMTALFWVPYVLERMLALGVFGALKPVEPEDELKQALWARRAKRAHYNAVENLVVFSTLVLVAAAMGKAEAALAYLTGFAAQIIVAIEIFTR